MVPVESAEGSSFVVFVWKVCLFCGRYRGLVILKGCIKGVVTVELLGSKGASLKNVFLYFAYMS